MVKSTLIFIVMILIWHIYPCLAEAPKAPSYDIDYQAQMNKMEEERKKFEQEYLESLKKTDPAAHKRQMEGVQRQDKINNIMTDYAEGKISYESAKRLLYYPVRDMIEAGQDDTANKIKGLEKALEELKRQQRDKSYAINKEIDRILGKATPDEYYMP